MIKVKSVLPVQMYVYIHVAIVCYLWCSAKQCVSSGTTTMEYSEEVANQYVLNMDRMHWLHDGHQSTVLTQLETINRLSKVPPSEMSVIDIACGEGKYCDTQKVHAHFDGQPQCWFTDAY